MPGWIRHIAVAFWLFSSSLCTCGQSWGGLQDSLFVKGRVVTTADSTLGDLGLQVQLGDLTLAAGDSIETGLHRGTMLTGWARGLRGRLQFEVSWPKYTDTCRFWVGCDTLGLTTVCAMDTLHWNWAPEDTGCFPVATSHGLSEVLVQAQRLPFESSRLNLIVDWLEGKCVSAEQIERLASAFDDEARRLEVIQSATCTSPFQLHKLEGLFTSQHYRSAFTEWASRWH